MTERIGSSGTPPRVRGTDNKWLVYAIPVVLIACIGGYYLFLGPNSNTGEPGGVEGIITDELGRALEGFRVSIIDGSLGFRDRGNYQ